jgi:hypothetical protein
MPSEIRKTIGRQCASERRRERFGRRESIVTANECACARGMSATARKMIVPTIEAPAWPSTEPFLVAREVVAMVGGDVTVRGAGLVAVGATPPCCDAGSAHRRVGQLDRLRPP